jgi:redox-sensitive bicupin YhaK (pirin superfamily)
MQIIRANTRGNANFGWLDSYHSFSFGHYFNPNRMGFGKLRVFNDDTVQAGMGFGTHPHDNMEIITIPTRGIVKHKDSMGTNGEILPWEVQVMSAGTGITHSEFNPSAIEDLHFFQIWILPEKRNIKPRYDQKNFKNLFQKNEFIQLVGSEQSGEYLTINQDAYISRAIVDKEKEFVYTSKNSESSIFIFLIEGKIQNEDNVLKRRDSIGIINSRKNIFTSLEDSDVLVIEVPN